MAVYLCASFLVIPGKGPGGSISQLADVVFGVVKVGVVLRGTVQPGRGPHQLVLVPGRSEIKRKAHKIKWSGHHDGHMVHEMDTSWTNKISDVSFQISIELIFMTCINC